METLTPILLAEDRSTDAELAQREILRVLPHCTFRIVETEESYRTALEEFRPHIIITDYSMPRFDGMAALQIARTQVPATPVIILTGAMNEDTAVECMKAGAVDYVIKEHIKRLGQAVLHALAQRDFWRAQIETERDLRLMRLAVESSLSAISFIDADGVIRIVNNSYCALWGYAHRSAVVGRRALELHELGPIPEEVRTALLAHTNFVGEIRATKVDGTRLDLQMTITVLRDSAGEPQYTMAAFLDISERKRAERQLRRSEERYRRFFEDDVSGVYLSTPDGRLLACNPAFVRMMGFASAEEVLAVPMARLYGSDYEHSAFLARLRAQQRLENAEIALLRKDGVRLHTVENVIGVYENGELKEYIGYIIDITEQKKSDEMRRLLAHTMESVIEIATITDLQDRFTFVNEAFLQTYGYTREEVIGRHVGILWSPNNPPHLLDEILGSTRSGSWRGEILNVTKDGREFPVALRTSQVRDDQGTILGLVGISEDITERRASEQRLRASLREKEALLREIHHRVKNNLQVISSLLNMQGAQTEDPRIKTVLTDSQHRIRAMALIHEALYRTDNFAGIDLSVHIRTMLNELVRSYRPAHLATNVELESVQLPIDVAVPCGLIVNELVTNALKHAFPRDRAGVLTIRLRRSGRESVELTVADDGVGIPPGVNFRESSSMGMTLITTLTHQISGTITLEEGPGTRFVLTFPG